MPDVALLFHFTLHRHVLRRDVPSIASKMAGATLLLLSTGVVAGGRTIAFT